MKFIGGRTENGVTSVPSVSVSSDSIITVMTIISTSELTGKSRSKPAEISSAKWISPLEIAVSTRLGGVYLVKLEGDYKKA